MRREWNHAEGNESSQAGSVGSGSRQARASIAASGIASPRARDASYTRRSGCDAKPLDPALNTDSLSELKDAGARLFKEI